MSTEIGIYPLTKDLDVIPRRATDGSAAYDLKSSHSVTLTPGSTVVVRTGIHVKMPKDYCALVFPRSGLATKFGIRLANSVGVIDSDYDQEWLVPLYRDIVERHTQIEDEDLHAPVILDAGSRIAQVIFLQLPKVDVKLLETFTIGNDKSHGSGFGGTGIK